MQLVVMAVVTACALALPAANAKAAEPSAPLLNREAANGTALPTWARAYTQGQWPAAIELLETIPEASRTAWHWLHLARALEKRTQLVESFAAYERLFDVAAEGAALPGMKDIERQAKVESSALEKRIPWAEVALGDGLPAGALVFVDQQWLEPARLRSPYPVNPGWHTFLVESNGEVLAARRTFFEEGQSRLVPLSSFSERTASPIASSGGAGRYPADEHPSAYAAPRRRALTWRSESQPIDADRQDQLLEATYVSLGIGVLGASTGTGFALAARNGGEDTGARASAATASFAIGFGALISGGVFWALHQREAARAPSVARIELEPSIYPSGAALRGTF
jgi:hypothetical protein